MHDCIDEQKYAMWLLVTGQPQPVNDVLTLLIEREEHGAYHFSTKQINQLNQLNGVLHHDKQNKY